jgi:hypothetical protein
MASTSALSLLPAAAGRGPPRRQARDHLLRPRREHRRPHGLGVHLRPRPREWMEAEQASFEETRTVAGDVLCIAVILPFAGLPVLEGIHDWQEPDAGWRAARYVRRVEEADRSVQLLLPLRALLSYLRLRLSSTLLSSLLVQLRHDYAGRARLRRGHPVQAEP